MKILGIESSSNVASVAVLENNQILCEYTMNNTMKHSKTLMPMIDEILNRLGISIREIELVAVSEGPGSFTGLRIGSATAKGLAHGLNIPVVNVPTLEMMASSIGIPNVSVGVLVHSRADEVYYALFRTSNQEGILQLEVIQEINEYKIENLIEQINERKETTFILGDGVEVFKENLKSLGEQHVLVKEVYSHRSAKYIALLGYQRYLRGDFLNYQEQKPYYFKKAQAERELEERQNDSSHENG
ncbi:MAG: tRNA (adenosine(37)-N6)-threonylcarbamoyltransferase complex dimerization subunit type 1 TsaB [Vallitaleaceae bacterium]|nr:tRNA (adenosine(37)-N6)-threonylcarbamoyltransferase complex dimerization subunit type 1 TsaB [Vallitaleaceae bacterium]